jgi:hypothetical protein
MLLVGSTKCNLFGNGKCVVERHAPAGDAGHCKLQLHGVSDVSNGRGQGIVCLGGQYAELGRKPQRIQLERGTMEIDQGLRPVQ